MSTKPSSCPPSGLPKLRAALRNAGLIALGDKGYHGYDKLRCSPHRAGRLAKAIHMLHDREITAG